MSKSDLRKARKAARANGQPLTGELATDRNTGSTEWSESLKGYRARDTWARWYDSLNGAPEGEGDR